MWPAACGYCKQSLKACRALLDGQTAQELPQPQLLSIQSRCPKKWLAVDTETGEIWRATDQGWVRAGEESVAALKAIAAARAA